METNIKGYEGRYKIDIYGNVWQTHRKKKSKLKPYFRADGRLEVRLSDGNGKRKSHNVSRLVATHFLKKPYLGESVMHLNGNKKDAYVENLKWVSNRHLGLKYGYKAKSRRVCKIKDGEVIAVYRSGRAAAKANYMSYSTVLDRCNGTRKGVAPDGHDYRYEDRGQ